jgi:hypothetical protein
MRLLALTAVLWSVAGFANAQGGPPFRTDDPETPGNKHWEINFGWVGDRNPADGAYQVPDFDINYGLGDRIQLKYELPIAIEELRPVSASPGQPAQQESVNVGLGESLLGVKIRFYEHHPGDPWIGRNPPSKTDAAAGAGESEDEKPVNLSVGTYPQLSLDNPTSSIRRGVVAQGPDFFEPLEVNWRLGVLRFDGEVGYHFGNKALPQSWSRGLLMGHEFSDRTETYVEIYDQQDADRKHAGLGVGAFSTDESKQRETTLGLGGRQALNKDKTLNLLLMGGRSFQTVTASNGQPSWIAYVGVQVLLGPKEPLNPQVEPKVPNESGKP